MAYTEATRSEFNHFRQIIDDLWKSRKLPTEEFHSSPESFLSRNVYNCLTTDTVDVIHETLNEPDIEAFYNKRHLFRILKLAIFGDIPNSVFP